MIEYHIYENLSPTGFLLFSFQKENFTVKIQIFFLFIFKTLTYFSGASPVRRDYGRGLTAQQWARYCGRYLCAESIEKFVRTAVPGGASLIADSSYFSSPMSSSGHVSRRASKGQNGEKSGSSSSSKAKSLKLRSRSASGIKNTSWLTRTFKKAFNHHHSNFEGGGGELEADFDKGSSSSSESRGSSSNAAVCKGRRPSLLRKSRKKEDHKGLVIPQVQVTGTYSDYRMNERTASFFNCCNTASFF